MGKVVFVKRTVKRKFSIISMWTNEDIKKRTEDEDYYNGFETGAVEPPPDVPQPTQVDKHPAEDSRRYEIEVVNKTYSSLL